MHADATQLLEKFLNQLTIEQRASGHTVKSYQRDLKQLANYCTEKLINDWQSVQQSDIRSYIAHRHRQGIGSKSLQRQLSATRSFYNYLLKNHLANSNPAQHIKAPKQARKLPKTLDVDQMTGLLEAGANSVLEIRDVAMFELFYSSGLRLSELTALDLSDMDLPDQSLVVRAGKGGKSRLLPVGSKAVTALENWLLRRVKIAMASETAVFISTRGTRLSQRSVELRLAQWCKKKVSPNISTHTC